MRRVRFASPLSTWKTNDAGIDLTEIVEDYQA